MAQKAGSPPLATLADENGTPITVTGGALSVTSSGGGGGAVTIADGADIAQGAVADAESTSGSGTVIAILKNLRTRVASIVTALGGGLPAALGSQGALKVEGVASGTAQPVSGSVGVTGNVATTVADGANITIGTTTDADASGNGSVIGILKRLRTLIAGGLPAALGSQGALKVEGVASGTAQPISGTVTANAGTGPFPVSDNGGTLTVDSIDGGQATIGTTTDAAATGNGTVIGLLKQARVLLAGGLPAALGSQGAMKVEGVASGTAQPVSGTVTANAGSGTFTVDSELPAAVALADGNANPTAPLVGACVMGQNGESWYRVFITNNGADSVGNNFGLMTTGLGYAYNGTNFDRLRNNVAVALLASSARTTTQTGSDTTNHNGRGLVLTVDVTSAGTGSITPKVQGKDANGIYYDIWVAAAAITANGTKVYHLYPGATGAGAVTEAVATVLPRTYRVVVTANNANSMTYSAATSLIV